jgi:excisionase family DNA binding protein
MVGLADREELALSVAHAAELAGVTQQAINQLVNRGSLPAYQAAGVTFRLPDRLVKRAKSFAIDANLDLQDVVREALERYLAAGKNR